MSWPGISVEWLVSKTLQQEAIAVDNSRASEAGEFVSWALVAVGHDRTFFATLPW